MLTRRWSYRVLLFAVFFSSCVAPIQPLEVEVIPEQSQPAAEAQPKPDAQPAPEQSSEPAAVEAPVITIPAVVSGKFNIAFVYVGPIGDGGWTYAHDQGRQIVQKYMGNQVATAYVESVPEGEAALTVLRDLANAGFDAIFTTSFGFMDPTAQVAEEFPSKFFVHVSGFKNNGKNFANMFGAMEDMKYLVGMIAGARAKEDGSMRVGYVASHPIPEVIRYVNATAIGMRRTCPECIMDLRWTRSWFDPAGESNAAVEMLDAGASVIVSGVDGTGPVQVAGERGQWGIGYDSDNACVVNLERCLTTSYWDWGQTYIWMIKKMLNGKFVGDNYYFGTTSNGVGLLGFMSGQEIASGVPTWVKSEVRSVLDQMLNGSFDRFTIFSGPLRNNKGEIVVESGVVLEQSDLEGLSNIPKRDSCTICMNWLVEGIVSEAILPQ